MEKLRGKRQGPQVHRCVCTEGRGPRWQVALTRKQPWVQVGLLACQLDVHVAVQQQVLGLEVPVDYVVAVAVLHSRQDLPELLPGFTLAEVPVRCQII